MKRVLWFTALFAVTSLLTACGGNQGPSTNIDIAFTEFAFTPRDFAVPAGQEITVHAINNGAVIHEFVIMKQGVRLTSEVTTPAEEDVYWSIQSGIGEEVDGTFTAPTVPGEYQIICGIPGHFISGMTGTLHVVAAP
ncbi:MAG: plastocyanin/azurin family copper-binding protein [Chloroflexota bacterium]